MGRLWRLREQGSITPQPPLSFVKIKLQGRCHACGSSRLRRGISFARWAIGSARAELVAEPFGPNLLI